MQKLNVEDDQSKDATDESIQKCFYLYSLSYYQRVVFVISW